MYPVVHIAYTGSIFMIVLVSFERYVTVYRMEILSIKMTIIYMGMVTFFAILSNIPSMLIFKWEETSVPIVNSTIGSLEETIDQIIATRTDISCHNDHIKRYNTYVLNPILRFILPIIALVGFNIFIFKKVIKLIYWPKLLSSEFHSQKKIHILIKV